MRLIVCAAIACTAGAFVAPGPSQAARQAVKTFGVFNEKKGSGKKKGLALPAAPSIPNPLAAPPAPAPAPVVAPEPPPVSETEPDVGDTTPSPATEPEEATWP